MARGLKVAVVGGGWAGLAAAVGAVQSGHRVSLFEASGACGGRARALNASLPDGTAVRLDNGQHVLIGAYAHTLGLMQTLGVAAAAVLWRTPLTLRFPDGLGLRLRAWPAPLDALAGILGASGWTWSDKLGLLHATLRWRHAGFACDPGWSVSRLCQGISPRVMQELIEPLCVSALNTPAPQASGTVFLRVLHDALLGPSGSSHLLVPKTDLSQLLPEPAVRWLQKRGARLFTRARIVQVVRHSHGWHLISAPAGDAQPAPESFDAVIWATPATQAIAMASAFVGQTADHGPARQERDAVQQWLTIARGLRFEAIATVYAWAAQARLNAPMLALRSRSGWPAQFVFDRGQLAGPPGLLAFVVSASAGTRQTLQDQVLAQARTQLGLELQAVLTVVDKRATFACTPALQRPPQRLAPGLLACGDYVEGPYPATLEGAVRSGLSAAHAVIGSGAMHPDTL